MQTKTYITMKKFFVLLAIVTLLLPSCQKINDRIDGLEDRIDQIEGTQIATINQQIEAINTTLPQLRETDTELKEYIKSLQTTATNLQEQITNTNKDIDELEAALNKAIADAEASDDALKTELVAQLNTAKADILAQLESTKTALEAELAQINSTIITLQAKDTELEGKIATLEEYVNTELQNTEDWATATFATLEQYNTIVEDIATIKTQTEALNTSLTNLEERLNSKIATDIATAVEGLQGELATKVTEITTAYTDAISTAKEEITAAYTEAIATAISNLESSLKQWVNEQLTGYYTIAEIDATLNALQKSIDESNEALANDITELSEKVDAMKVELTEAYNSAIEEAINTNNGVIDGKIAESIADVNDRIDSEVAAINARISALEERVDDLEQDVEYLLSRIQSISYIPKYSDGKAYVENGIIELDYHISPKSTVIDIANNWKTILSVKAIYTISRTVSFVDMPVVSCEADAENGVITITVSAENLCYDFYVGNQYANLALHISDGNIDIISDYTSIYPTLPYNEIYRNSWERFTGKYWNGYDDDSEFMFQGRSTDGSVEIMFDCYAFPRVTDKIAPEGTYTIAPWEAKDNYQGDTLYVMDQSHITYNTIKGNLKSGTVKVEHIAGGYRVSYKLIDTHNRAFCGVFEGALTTGSSMNNPQ